MPRPKTATQPKAKYTDRTGRINPRVRPTDPETGEPLIGEDLERAAAHTPGTTGKASTAEKALYLQKAEQSLRWQQLKNEKAEKEMQAKLGNLVDRDVFMRQVVAANVSVKNQVLAVIERANLPHEIRVQLKQQMMAALNDLAYEHGYEHGYTRS